jgi:GNAT superfamily N-acetyltransferase
MTLTWTKEDRPRWDADKRRLFGEAELASVGRQAAVDDAFIADEWWRVTDETGTLVGYGWLDLEWGDARISFLVAPAHRGHDRGDFILEQLEAEARNRGLNYIYNLVPATHPDRPWMTHWLALHGFHKSARGDLRRQVRRPADTAAAS